MFILWTSGRRVILNNQQNGTIFESRLKAILKKNGLNVFLLAIPESADMVVLNGTHRLIECKTTHNISWKVKNRTQHDRLIAFAKEGISVYYAIRFTIGHKATIKFFHILSSKYPYSMYSGFTVDEFTTHVKKSGLQ